MADTNTIAADWTRIEAWLRGNWPGALDQLRTGAPASEIEATERLVGLRLPDEVKQFYRLHDGSEDVGLFPSSDTSGSDEMAFSPLPLSRVRGEWQNWKRLVEMGEFAGQASQPAAGIRADWWNCGWIPIASNGGGDFQCIDMAPDETGRTGQVISMWHENGRRELLAPSLSDYLQLVAAGLESGKYRYEEDYGIIASKR
jgi:cell wall assembly regulator SMI1